MKREAVPAWRRWVGVAVLLALALAFVVYALNARDDADDTREGFREIQRRAFK